MSTVLEVIQRFCRRTGLPRPTTVVGSTDNQVLQALALLEEEITDLAKRHNWQALTKKSTHTTLAAEDQGALYTIAPGYRYMLNETIWDENDDLPVIGPVSSKDWQDLTISALNGPRYQYRIRGNHLLANPVPTAGHTWSFEYQSKNAILDTDGTTTKEYFDNDLDTFLLPEELHLLGLRWRWNREKGLDYGELYHTYEFQVKDAMGRDGTAMRVSMDSVRQSQPAILVPNSNWVIP